MRAVSEGGFSANDRIGNYRVERELGPAGSGVLIEAHHLVLPRKAIVKVIHPAFGGVELFVLQTLREACILEAIAHAGVPIVYESGVLKDRRPWFAFEAISGPTLEDVLATGPCSVICVAGLTRDLADLLEHAHRRGVIHRGLKPDRIVMTSDRRFPLCIPDWSEALAHDAASHLPHSANGTDRHVAPELANHSAGRTREFVDERADMFALGVIAYRALTGRLPFAAVRDAAPQIAAHDHRPEAPRELASLIDALLAADRFDRPIASEVRAELDWLFSSLPALQPPRPTDRSSPTPTGGHEVVLLEPPRLRRPRWTPDLHYLETETTDVDIERETVDDDLE